MLVGQDQWRSVTQLDAEELSGLRYDAPEVTPEQRTLAASAWAAFTAEDPRALEPLAAGALEPDD